MTNGILVGAIIGYVAMVVLYELEIKLCRLCCVFWCSVLYCLFTGEWMQLGIINLAAHLSYLTLIKVAYVEEISLPISSRKETPSGAESGSAIEIRVQTSEEGSDSGSTGLDSRRA